MGIYDRQYYKNESQGFSLETLTRGQSIVIILIGINVAVFILDAILGSSPSGVGRLSEFLKVSNSDVAQPWYWFRFLTYGFAHANARHLLGNMIGLYFFGRAAEMVYGSRTFLWMYLTALLAGSVVWMAGVQFSGKNQAVLGASGGVAAVVILFCINFPNQKVYLLFLPFIGIPAWLLGVVFVGADLLGQFGGRSSSDIAFTVHLVGAAYAWIFYKTGWEISRLWGGSVGSSGGSSLLNVFKRKPKLRVHRGPRDEVGQHDQLAARADAILKKLHQQGEASLTNAERKILEDYSRSIKQKNR